MNALNYLDFEKPIVELLAKIEELKHVSEQVSEGVEGVDLSKEIALLNQKDLELTKKIFSNLDAWQICRLARIVCAARETERPDKELEEQVLVLDCI